jgi:hypothetical protein
MVSSPFFFKAEANGKIGDSWGFRLGRREVWILPISLSFFWTIFWSIGFVKNPKN